METRSDNQKRVPVASKTRKPYKETGLKKKVTAPSLDRQAALVSRKKEIPQLTPLHRLQRFKAIRDKNLKSKGFKTSLENKINKMEEVATAITTTIEIKEKPVIKETFEGFEISNTNGIEERTTIKEANEDVEVSNSNGIDKSEDVQGIENETKIENRLEESNTPSKEEPRRSVRLKEIKNDDKCEEDVDKGESDSKSPETTSHEPEPVQDNNIESNSENEEAANKVYPESLPESDAVSSISSQQAVTNSTPGPTDDEDEVEIIESKPEYELDSTVNEIDSLNEEKKEVPVAKTFSYKKEAPEPYNRGMSSCSAASSYKSSYSNLSRIYGRRPVRHIIASRKRKMEEEGVKNCDFKRMNSPSQPSPRWRFFPSSVNFWTPRTTPFIFPASTPIKSFNDSMTVNVDEETIRSHLDDSDLFSDADEFAPQPAKKGRWGCAVM